ncbi:CoA transferase [Bosea sp. BK604]|uniref:CaiB/BaiF CoA transferase family protein n=1 Tax=Bosea sp. BK604 TaxID=2512180 RepID=UPI001045B7AD|nr:CoA transferase [Bosea sp. BK604]TCR62470.1 crotonobetainyl-CoA:carnitine CoA-transferase CaiB-like acyl-CoA transferase [Bosea sp. BK604]
MTRVLAGIRVIEFGRFITGPYAAMLLADLGADVVKVERAGSGDPFRSFEKGLYGPQFQAFNRNKRSIALDFELEQDQAAFRDLIAGADVLIQNSRPGAADRFGIGPEQARTLNPRLVHCEITGFGRDGPYARRPAYDTVAQAVSGFLSMFVSPEEPRIVGPAVSDSVTGLYAALGIMGALMERERTGQGRLVEISMLEATMHFAVEQFQGYFVNGKVPSPRDRGRVSQSLAFRCADGRTIALHLSSPPKFWNGLLQAIGRPDLAQDPRFVQRMDRVRNHDQLEDVLRPIFASQPRAHWLPLLEAADVPHAPVLGADEVVADPQVRHLGIDRTLVHPTEGEVRTLRTPIVYDGNRDGIVMTPPPVLDEHGAEIRRELAAAAPAPAMATSESQ